MIDDRSRLGGALLVLAVAPLLARGLDPLACAVAAAAVVAATGVAASIAVSRARARAACDAMRQNRRDVDAVVSANLELRVVRDPGDAGRRIARIVTELLEADGAAVFVQGPGRLLCAGRHGCAAARDGDVVTGSTLDRVLRAGAVGCGDGQVVLPLTGSRGVFGAVAVAGARRPVESFVTSVLQLFAAHAGSALERLGAVETLIDARFLDPVTGVGNRVARADGDPRETLDRAGGALARARAHAGSTARDQRR